MQKLVKLLEDRFNRSVVGMNTKKKTETKILDNNNLTRFPLDASFQGVIRLFVLVFNNTQATIPHNPIINSAKRFERNSHRIYFLPRIDITNYSVLIVGRNFYDQLINDMIIQYDEIRTIATR